jgi:RNA-directed DNA polymerase
MVATSDRAETEDRRPSRYRQAKATKRGGMGVWKSEPFVVPWKPGNSRPEDPVKGREGRVCEPWEGNMAGTPSPGTVSTKQARIAELAKQAPALSFTTLAHHIDLRWLYEAFLRTRRDGATGVDGQTSMDYAADLRGNLQRLLDRAKSGTYRAPPVRRVHIPKGTGSETRPIGIPTFEDKVLQRAVVMVLESVYEQDFYDCSYGFRPGRSAHQALETLWQQTMAMGGGWVVEVDIQKFFDTLDHARLRELLQRRVSDGVLLRLIGKWLNAGVLEGDVYTTSDQGTPQGGVISPLLANVYLHYVLDEWFEREVKPRLAGRAFLIRYADDFVMVFRHETDARRVLEVLPKRFAKYGLTLHPDKTRLVPFPRPSQPPDAEAKGPQPGTFDLLGFTHFWGRSRRGGWVIQRQTASNRFSRAVKKIAQWCRRHRHLPVVEQHQVLSQKLRGHDAYYGITGNYRALTRLRHEVRRVWRKWLARRRAGPLSWDRFRRLVARLPLPPPRVVHSALAYS